MIRGVNGWLAHLGIIRLFNERFRREPNKRPYKYRKQSAGYAYLMSGSNRENNRVLLGEFPPPIFDEKHTT